MWLELGLLPCSAAGLVQEAVPEPCSVCSSPGFLLDFVLSPSEDKKQ